MLWQSVHCCRPVFIAYKSRYFCHLVLYAKQHMDKIQNYRPKHKVGLAPATYTTQMKYVAFLFRVTSCSNFNDSMIEMLILQVQAQAKPASIISNSRFTFNKSPLGISFLMNIAFIISFFIITKNGRWWSYCPQSVNLAKCGRIILKILILKWPMGPL